MPDVYTGFGKAGIPLNEKLISIGLSINRQVTQFTMIAKMAEKACSEVRNELRGNMEMH